MQDDLVKEEEYYNLLIKIYRSPELIRKLTGLNIKQ